MLHRRQLLWGSIGTAIAALRGSGAHAAAARTDTVRATVKQAVAARESSAGMVAVVIDQRGNRTVSYGSSGVAGVALDGNTVFEIMSITKVLTSLVLADMVERHEVAFDDPLAKYLPASANLRVLKRPITLLDLATYTSGLPNMPGNLPSDWYARPDPLGSYTSAQLDEFVSGYVPEYEPGTHYRYANLAFGLLGNALAHRAGKTYEALLIERVCEPLGLRHTRITLTADMQKHLTQGHALDGTPTPLWNFPALPGAGTVRSNAKDLTVFLKACMGLTRTPLSAALERLRATRRPTPLAGTDAGLGWFMSSNDSENIVWKSGLSGGCNTFVGFSTRKRRGAIVLCNFLWRPIDAGTIALGVNLINPQFHPGDFSTLYSDV